MKDMTIKDETLRRHLLGQMSDEERDRTDEAYFGDRDFLEQLSIVEDELIESFVHGELSASDRRQFEEFFLRSPERRKRVALARKLEMALARARTAKQKVERPVSASRFEKFPLPSRWMLLPLAASLLLATLCGWLFWQINRTSSELEGLRAALSAREQKAGELEQQLTEEQKRNRELLDQLARADNRKQTPDRNANSSPGSRIVSFILMLGISRSEGNTTRLVIPPGAEQARVQLNFKIGDYRNYAIALETVEGKPVLSRTGLRASKTGDGKAVTVTLPVAALDEQDYLLTLNGITSTSEREAVGRYFFRVVRP